MEPDAKLYIVVNASLPPGKLLAQAIHAARQFAEEYPELERTWFACSNTVAVLSAPNEAALHTLRARARAREIKLAGFCEPDLAPVNEPSRAPLTALAFAPGPEARRLLRRYPLALS